MFSAWSIYWAATAQSSRAKRAWTQTSATLRQNKLFCFYSFECKRLNPCPWQNKPFPLLSWLSQLFPHSDRKLLNSQRLGEQCRQRRARNVSTGTNLQMGKVNPDILLHMFCPVIPANRIVYFKIAKMMILIFSTTKKLSTSEVRNAFILLIWTLCYTYIDQNITLYHKYIITECQLQVNFSKERKINWTLNHSDYLTVEGSSFTGPGICQ